MLFRSLAGTGLELAMDIRAYREKPVVKEGKDTAKSGDRAAKRTALTLWDYLIDNAQAVKKRGV